MMIECLIITVCVSPVNKVDGECCVTFDMSLPVVTNITGAEQT